MATTPPLLADLVIGVLRQRVRVTVIAMLDTRDGLGTCLRQAAPDLLLLGLFSGETDELAAALRDSAPATAILALAPDGGSAWLHDSAGRQVIRELSIATLHAALCGRAV